VARVIQVLSTSIDDQAVLRAAFGILDRAGMETAAKAPSAMSIEIAYADVDLDQPDGDIDLDATKAA